MLFQSSAVFSLRRPKDIKAGLSSGLKSLGKGIVGGAVGLLAAPIVGAATDGLPGFAKGMAAGKVMCGRTATNNICTPLACMYAADVVRRTACRVEQQGTC
jgi:hypothetical protein